MAFLDNSSTQPGCLNSWLVPNTVTTSKVALPSAGTYLQTGNTTNDVAPLYMTDLRLTRGQLVYSGNSFSVPTAPLQATTNTQLLLRASTGTHGVLAAGQFHSGANVIVDVSQNNYNPSPSYGPLLASDLSPYGSSSTGSVLSPGSNSSYLQYTANAFPALNFNWTSNDFTAEMFFNLQTLPPAGTNLSLLTRTCFSPQSQDWAINLNPSGALQLWWWSGGANNFYSNVAVTTNTWNHAAFTYSAATGNVNLYLNGSRTIQANATNSVQYANPSDIFITGPQVTGVNGSNYTTPAPVTVNVTDVRISRGLQAYTGPSYTIPSAPLQATANTQLLLRSQRAVVVTDNQGAGTQTTFASNVQFAAPVVASNLQATALTVSNLQATSLTASNLQCTSVAFPNGTNVLTGSNFQCGSVTSNASGTYVTVTFAKAFNNVPTVVATSTFSSGGSPSSFLFSPCINNVTKTGFQIYGTYITSGSNTINYAGSPFSWMALSPTG